MPPPPFVKELCSEYTCTTNIFYFALCFSAEKLGLDNQWLFWEVTFPKNFIVTRSDNINHGCYIGLVLELFSCIF